MEINLARDGITDNDSPTALIYYGRYEVKSWEELYFAAVKTLYIEYPEVINSLVSKDPTRALYLRTTKIDMKQPARISTILYLDVSRTPTEIVKALREIFRYARVVNINMSIEVKRSYDITKYEDHETASNLQDTQNLPSLPSLPMLPIPINPPNFSTSFQSHKPAKSTEILEVPSFMKSESIRKVSPREQYIEQMKYLVKTYPNQMKKEAGIFLNNRRVTLAESGYRYFMEEVELGEGLSIELNFSDDDIRENIKYYQQLMQKFS